MQLLCTARKVGLAHFALWRGGVHILPRPLLMLDPLGQRGRIIICLRPASSGPKSRIKGPNSERHDYGICLLCGFRSLSVARPHRRAGFQVRHGSCCSSAATATVQDSCFRQLQ